MSTGLKVTLEGFLRDVIRDVVREELHAFVQQDSGRSKSVRPAAASDTPMTTVEASRYCGFKTTAAIRKALLDGRLAPLGRRGGTGTYMWSRQALDAFLAGARGGIVRVGRPDAPPTNNGGHHGRNEVGREMAISTGAEARPTGRLADEGRWIPGSRSSHGLSDREATTSHAGGARHGRRGRVQGASGSSRRRAKGTDRGDGAADALQRIRRVAFRAKGGEG